MTTTTLVTGDGDAAVGIQNTTNVVASPVTPSYLPGAGLAAYTMEMLVNVTAYPVGGGDQLYGSNPDAPVFHIAEDGILNFNTDSVGCSGPTLSLGVTYHLCATYDGANVVLYVNGAAVDTQAQTGLDGVDAGQFFEVGYSRGRDAQFVADEVAFYSTALSPVRVAAHFAALPVSGGGGGGTGAGPEVHMFREQLLLVVGHHHRRDPLMLISPLSIQSRSDADQAIQLPFFDASPEFF